MDSQVEEIKDWLDALDDAVDAEDYGRYEDILESLYREGHLKYLVQQAEQLHSTRHRKGYKSMYGECNVDYANLNSKNKDLEQRIKDLEEKLSTVLGSYEIAFSQNEHHRKLAESYKQVLNFYSNEKNYYRPYDDEDYFDYLPSAMISIRVKRRDKY